MSLDLTFTNPKKYPPNCLSGYGGQPMGKFDFNITHNLTEMADEAGIYKCLWRPEENGFERCEQIIEPLRASIKDMEKNPEKYKKHNPPNGWGNYDGFLEKCKEIYHIALANPDFKITSDR